MNAPAGTPKRPCGHCGKPTAARSGHCRTTRECRRLDSLWKYSSAPETAHARNRAWYANNRDAQRARIRNWRSNNPEKTREIRLAGHLKKLAWLRSLRVGKRCVDCALVCTEQNCVAFDWDHRPGVIKLFNVSQALRLRRTEKEIFAEIAKCDLRCKNCHAIITEQRIRQEQAA